MKAGLEKGIHYAFSISTFYEFVIFSFTIFFLQQFSYGEEKSNEAYLIFHEDICFHILKFHKSINEQIRTYFLQAVESR